MGIYFISQGPDKRTTDNKKTLRQSQKQPVWYGNSKTKKGAVKNGIQ